MTLGPALVVVRGTPAVLAEAEAALAAEEATLWRSFTVPKRRIDWLLGRFATKLAARRLLGDAPPLAAIVVTTGPGGAPRTLLGPDRTPGPAVSISHSDGCAVALAADHPVGVDLEQRRAMPPGSARFYLTEAEQAWLSGQPWGPESALALWAMKEAGYKAIEGRCGVLTRLTFAPEAPGHAWLREGDTRLAVTLSTGAAFCLAVAVPEAQAHVLASLDLEAALANL